jgi:hypothetical protein
MPSIPKDPKYNKIYTFNAISEGSNGSNNII